MDAIPEYILLDRVTSEVWSIFFENIQMKITNKSAVVQAEPVFVDTDSPSEHWKLFISDGQLGWEDTVESGIDSLVFKDSVVNFNVVFTMASGQPNFKKEVIPAVPIPPIIVVLSGEWKTPTVSDFKNFFMRDFNYAQPSDPNNMDFIMDIDISRAIDEALINFNIGLWGTNPQITNVFLYLAAFCLVRNLQNSTKGLSNQSRFPITSTTVGSVSVSYQVPDKYSKDPYLGQFIQNGYGLRYLEFAMPYLIGNVGLVEGYTTWD